MKKEEQWVCWRNEKRDGKPTKVPVNPYTGGFAKANDTSTWSDFSAAIHHYRSASGVDGIGFMFHKEGLYAGVDLDDCRDPATGDVETWAKDIIKRLDSYTELSPSGTGYHVIVYGFVPEGGNRRGDIEMYDRNRYFTVTGERLDETPRTVKKRVNRLRNIHREYIVSIDPGERIVPESRGNGVDLPDEELIERAMEAANGDKFRTLWNGDTSGYRSHSEADQALCNLLAFWTGGDPQRIEELFARSGLVREKWRNRSGYRRRTIRNAIRSCTEFYDPSGRSG